MKVQSMSHWQSCYEGCFCIYIIATMIDVHIRNTSLRRCWALPSIRSPLAIFMDIPSYVLTCTWTNILTNSGWRADSLIRRHCSVRIPDEEGVSVVGGKHLSVHVMPEGEGHFLDEYSFAFCNNSTIETAAFQCNIILRDSNSNFTFKRLFAHGLDIGKGQIWNWVTL